MTRPAKTADDFAQVDRDRLAFIGAFRCYRVYRNAQTGEYWTTIQPLGNAAGEEFAGHSLSDPLPDRA